MIGLGESVDVDNKLIDKQDAVKMSRVAEWVDQTEELKPIITEQKKVNELTNLIQVKSTNFHFQIPIVYRGLCYRFFLTNQCTLKFCTKSHTITLHKQRLASLTDQKLFIEAYNFAKSEPIWFSKMFHVFADIFASRGLFQTKFWFNQNYVCTFADNKLALIEILETILVTLNDESRIEGVNTILKQLQKCTNLTIFEDVVKYVMAKVDTKKYPILGELFSVFKNCLSLGYIVKKVLVVAFFFLISMV